ncbi:hypothetical protein [Aliiglaciecola litoralis]|uniref:Anti-sigma factor n=1 Tax=Aliiglaciecola litoralis TaxID=582857 RepID=A0ABN1LSV5_9ALTE
MNKANFEADLRAKLAQLEKDKQPERDLWAGIEIALADEDTPNQIRAQRQPKQRPKMVAIAASVALVGVLTWYGMQSPVNEVSGQDLVAALSSQHEQQKNALLVKFEGQPALTQNWETQLAELDEATIAIKAALKHDPNNMALLKMLQSVHQQQINLIERVHSPKWRQL